MVSEVKFGTWKRDQNFPSANEMPRRQIVHMPRRQIVHMYQNYIQMGM